MIILASASPRRKELLQNLRLKFKIVGSRYEENHSLRLKPVDLVRLFAREKAKDVARRYPDDIVIGADTLVTLGPKALGKPHTPAAAIAMLEKISGKQISVLTALTVMCQRRNMTVSKVEKVRLRVKRLDATEIKNYVKTGEPLDKAGAFGIQGLGTVLIEGISGDYFSVVGLPLCSLAKILKKFGVNVL